MTDEEETEYELENFAQKKQIFLYIEQKGEDVTAPMVLGHFMMPPELREDVEMLIDLTYN